VGTTHLTRISEHTKEVDPYIISVWNQNVQEATKKKEENNNVN
jgi:hypothetical protein